MKILTLTIVLLVGTPALGYPQQERLMPDGAPVPEDAVDHEDSVAAASELENDEYDDSDMYMEPDGAESVREVNHEVNHEEGTSLVPVSNPEDEEAPASVEETNPEERISEQTAEKKGSADEEEDPSDKSLESDSQNFFPSFAKLFANHRTPFEEQQQQQPQQQQQQQQHYRPNRFLGYFQRDHEAYQASAANDNSHPILGSGNFGVIRGGTYYPEEKEKENDEYSVDETLYNPYFQNTRTRTNYYRNPKPQSVRGGDFFANFRDFADITAPPKSSFSHLSVVYANKNGTRGRITEPRNIIETLRMLEQESESTTTEIPQKKLSKGKRKLLKLKKYQDDKTRKSRMTIEPLLALS